MVYKKAKDILSIENDKVKIVWSNTNIKYIPISEFNEQELNAITLKNFCPGCQMISNKGFKEEKKVNWCSFSRKLAILCS